MSHRTNDMKDRLRKNVPSGTHRRTHRSSENTAELLGISSRKVERGRAILDYNDPGIIKAINDGTMSVNQAYEIIQSRKRESKLLESMSPEDIGVWRRNELMKSLLAKVRKHLLLEARQYPGIVYSCDSRWDFADKFAAQVDIMMREILPSVRTCWDSHEGMGSSTTEKFKE